MTENDDAEHGWLAENPYARPHAWLAVDPKTADIYWTCDALLALRFARKTDCEQFIEVTQRSISGFVTRAIATEHGFAALTEQGENHRCQVCGNYDCKEHQ